MFYVLDILDYAAICSMSYLLWENPKYFSRFHMGNCTGNFEFGEIIDDATTFKVKVK